MSRRSAPTPATRSNIYGLASVADVDADEARIALEDGLDAVRDATTRARLEVAGRLLDVRFPSPRRAA